MFQGNPQLQPVIKDQNDLMFAVNSNWPVFFDATGQRYYLLNGDNWLMTADAAKGPWTPAGVLPKGLSSLPADENWAEVRAQIPGKRLSSAPTGLHQQRTGRIDTHPGRADLQSDSRHETDAGGKYRFGCFFEFRR